VFEEDGFDEVFDDGSFVGVELLGGFEGEFEVVVGVAFVVVEDEQICADVEGGGEAADVRRRPSVSSSAAYRFRTEGHCTAWHVEDAYDTLVEVERSDWVERTACGRAQRDGGPLEALRTS